MNVQLCLIYAAVVFTSSMGKVGPCIPNQGGDLGERFGGQVSVLTGPEYL